MRYAILILVLTTCTTPTGLPEGGVWLDPVPAEYAADWKAVEACSGTTGDFASVRWIVYPDRLVVPGTRNIGQAHHDTRIVELAGRALAPVIRHEMLHLLLGPQVTGHPDEYFVERCGEIVAH